MQNKILQITICKIILFSLITTTIGSSQTEAPNNVNQNKIVATQNIVKSDGVIKKQLEAIQEKNLKKLKQKHRIKRCLKTTKKVASWTLMTIGALAIAFVTGVGCLAFRNGGLH